MALKDWKKSLHHARPTTKFAWESKLGNVIAIDYVKSSNIPYKIILNSMVRKNYSGDLVGMDSTGTLKKAKKIVYNYMRLH